MSLFPGSGAQVYRNEAGEVIGWDYPNDDEMSYYCDICGFNHAGPCPDLEEEYDS